MWLKTKKCMEENILSGPLTFSDINSSLPNFKVRNVYLVKDERKRKYICFNYFFLKRKEIDASILVVDGQYSIC